MSEREVVEFDVVVVGAGPAGLATAMRLKQLDPERSVCVLEKGSQVGAHILSGAVIEPEPLDELLPGWRENPPPICVPATRDEFALLTRTRRIRLPTPPQQHNAGNYIVSLGALCAWLAPQAEALGVEIFPGFAAADVLYDAAAARVIGVRVGDMGVAKDGSQKTNYTQGIDIHGGVTVIAEGCRGSLAKQLIARFRLDSGADPQTYGIGIKELWELPEGRVEPGLIQHTVGWPLDARTYGGSFVYHLTDNRVALGFVAGLDYRDPRFEPYEAFQQWKHHPSVKPLLEGGRILAAGARALVEGGYQSLPRLEMPGALIVGDAGGLINVPKIKGTHMALRAGMVAAEHIAGQRTADGFDTRFRASVGAAELRRVRNIRPGFRFGLYGGMLNAGVETVLGGRTPWTLRNHADHTALERLERVPATAPGQDYVARTLEPRDRLAGVYFAATEHDEDQPVHLRILDPNICTARCTAEYGNPCTRFCPAAVYEMVGEGEERHLQINAANCVHCKTCDIKDPYGIIDWVPPEGGAGPNYENL